jgi:hypothetical protein
MEFGTVSDCDNNFLSLKLINIARRRILEWACKVLVGKPEGKRPCGRPRRRRENGIRMDLRETG